MNQWVVISGKGGSGKTSIVASIAVLARGRVVIADCDVDAADLHLVLDPHIQRSHDFIGGNKARIESELCGACGKCEQLCRFGAIFFDGPKNERHSTTFRVDRLACEGCGVCAHFCAERAIEFAPAVCGQWFVSKTRWGPLLHARMDPGAENSGKLVTVIRQRAREIAQREQLDLVLCDGSPGIGCPVIASLTGADAALIVVEPTTSGLHDFQRVAQLCRQMNVLGYLLINKADLNQQMAVALEEEARRQAVVPVGRVPYDSAVTQAQIAGRTVVEVSDGPASRAIQAVWLELQRRWDSRPAKPRGTFIHLR